MDKMLDIIQELLVVDTEEGFVASTSIEGDSIVFVTNSGDSYKLTLQKL